MTTQPLISIITITFNAAAEIAPTLESVNQQTWCDFEHIIVDGASNDDTIGIVRAMSHARILSEPDRGLYDAMNKGIGLARGKYLLFLNAGDSFHSPDTLQAYAEAAMKGADIIYGDTEIVNSNRETIGPRHLSAPAILKEDSFADGMLICHQAFMVRKEIAPEYDLAYRFSADYDWCIKCILNSQPDKRVNLGRVTIDYLSDGMTDKNKLTSLRERYRIMSTHYGSMRTAINHLKFVWRAFRRGSL
ncbi:MAG: glycosyltransferase [Muribaculaceae bacterium]|nr:glycosyltransferase [Muribaculaceae bacterium]